MSGQYPLLDDRVVQRHGSIRAVQLAEELASVTQGLPVLVAAPKWSILDGTERKFSVKERKEYNGLVVNPEALTVVLQFMQTVADALPSACVACCVVAGGVTTLDVREWLFLLDAAC